MNIIQVEEKLRVFLAEDIGHTDLTSSTIFPMDYVKEAKVIAKEAGVFSGANLIQHIYQILSYEVKVTLYKHDQDLIQSGDVLATITGPVQIILTGERDMINLLQRMSGIATINISDTRKTTPGFRLFEKHAITCGGGFNHRYGLYDGVMIKDNHIAAAGSITQAVEKVKNTLGHMVMIEVETESEAQVQEAI